MAKRIPPLTDRQLLNAKAKPKMYRLFDGGGLYLEVAPGGSRLWKFKYKRPGQSGKVETRLSFGSYPDISLADARMKRDEARRDLAQGKDPGEVRKAASAALAKKRDLAFVKVAKEWHASMLRKWQPKTADDIWNRLVVDIFPAIGNVPITELVPRDILAPLRKIEERGALELARRNAANIVRILNYAIACGDISQNPALTLFEVLEPQSKGHFAALGPDKIPELCEALRINRARTTPPVRIGMYLMALLFVRTSELIETPWAEIPLDSTSRAWIIPWKRMKMGRRRLHPVEVDHEVPLPWQARELLHELYQYTGDTLLLFPNERDRARPMSNNTFLKALGRMGYRGDMTGHGFRALAMTTLKERLHYRHEVVDRQLAHVQQNKTDTAYDRAFYLEERAKMLQDWADYLYRFGL